MNHGNPLGFSLRELMARARIAVAQTLPEAVWVRAEVSRAHSKGSYMLLDLVERSPKGEVAKVGAVIWNARLLLGRFEQGSGQRFTADLQVLVQARVKVHDRFGLQLEVLDIDPNYTRGVMVRQLETIRLTLHQEGIINANRQKPLPEDFFKVAVISPEGAAGLLDFQAKAGTLERFQICRFHYLTAIFQGPRARESLLKAIQQALTLPALDALVIIRGGGAIADLHWLNELELARAICHSPVPVITGIGHQNDQTILDEVAGCVEGTPSKAIELIEKRILQRATRTRNDFDAIQNAVKHRLIEAEREVEKRRQLLWQAAHVQIQQAQPQLDAAHLLVINGSRRSLEAASYRIDEYRRTVAKMTRRILRDAENRDLAEQRRTISQYSQAYLHRAEERMTEVHACVLTQAERWMRQAADHAWRLCREIRGQGPEKTLQRGFALVRDAGDHPVTSRAAARGQTRLILEFHDGRIAVKRDTDDE
jgi:exodeoxyribonuclease VII large subunit